MSEVGLNLYQTETRKYEGVGGWLLFFCIDLTCFFPAAAVYRVLSHTIPMLSKTHDTKRQVLWTVYAVMFLGIAAGAFVTGIRLWLVRSGAVRMAKSWLLMMLSAHVSYFFLWLVLFQHERTDPIGKVAWDHIVAPLISFCIWVAYLQYSKRVRDTYYQVDQSA